MKLDEQLRDAFRELGDQVRPEGAAWAHLEESLQRRMGRRLSVSIAVSLLILGVVGILTMWMGRPDRSVLAPGLDGWATFVQSGDADVARWSFAYPTGWDVQRSRLSGPFEGFEVLRVGNLDLGDDEDLREPARQPRMIEPPAPTVLVEFRIDWSDDVTTYQDLQTDFPVSIADAVPAQDAFHLSDGWRMVRVQRGLSEIPWRYSIWIWIGSESTAADRQIADKIVATARLVGEPDGSVMLYEDPRGAWTVEIPQSWDRQRAVFQSRRSTEITRFSDAVLGSDLEGGSLDAPENLTAPLPDAVLLDVVWAAGGPVPFVDESETTFPLSFRHGRAGGGSYHGRPVREISIVLNGQLGYHVRFWVGPDASPTTIEELRRALESLRFRQA